MKSLLKTGNKIVKSTKYANWDRVIDPLWLLMIIIRKRYYSDIKV